MHSPAPQSGIARLRAVKKERKKPEHLLFPRVFPSKMVSGDAVHTAELLGS